MIYVSQGHQLSIGLEIFIKSFLLLNQSQQSFFTLICFKKSLEQTLATLKIDFDFKHSNVYFLTHKKISLKCVFLDKSAVEVDLDIDQDLPQSTLTLLHAIELTSKDPTKNILLTLPTSKDQLILNGEKCKGYTEFFRSLYNNPNIPMLFYAENKYVLLVTDHIPLNEVSKKINSSLIHQKVWITINDLYKYFKVNINRVIFAGINPHAGEDGLLGSEEKEIRSAMESLTSLASSNNSLKNIQLLGPYSGDVLTFYQQQNSNDLLVYMFHDQGLSYFKSHYGFIGLNISLGLPFLRMSVDHGTAFELYGKNCANYLGALYLLNKALSLQSP
ncbi:MAG: 4-hydroxythreonine-4-phosphate dehydrogenase PdxA [Oligoflexia bacterium]|nr:4-hydroxythreonine-4-phosphate dehydrogenase PdxA [Oligoflexia bacterium]